MKRVMILLAPGFEEGETVEIIDILRRAGFECVSVSIAGEYVLGAHKIEIRADRVLRERLSEFWDYDMLVLPGGWEGVDNLSTDERVLELVRYYASHDKYIGAMCAAPNVLAKAGILEGRTITAYPGQKTEPFYKEARYIEDTVAFDGKLVTSRGPATVLPFAFALVDVLGGDSSLIKRRLLYNELKRYPDGVKETG